MNPRPPPPPPPPPPPHGNHAGNRNGLPDGHYDIFVVPPHSAGSGFLYLPSLQPHRNSFLAGVACTLFAVMIWMIVLPALRDWMSSIVAGGGMSVILLLLAVGVGGWAWGKTQIEGGFGGGAAGGARAHTGDHTSAGPAPGFTPPPEPRAPPPKPTWQRSNTGPANGTANTGTAKGGWEKAREETRKKEEERKKAEELRKKREDDEKERVRQREKDAREREAREKREKDRAARPASPTKGHHHPTAKTATDDDAYSFRPYDSPKRPANKTNSASSIFSESSYAPSHSTSRTTPPPSHRGPYRSKDPDKIVLKAVYAFNNVFMKNPVAKLISGVGSVTDGLILRITTEGLFIDDDVRGVPQREWDVKAWTLKLVEVWCPHLNALGASSGSTPASRNAATAGHSGMFGTKKVSKMPPNEESERFLDASARACKPCVSGGFGPHASHLTHRSDAGASSQSGEFNGLHVLRATIRDQEGRRYVFVLQEQEGWKVAVGLQRLRRGTQVRALGVSGMAVNETKAILENMGWI